MAIFNEAKEPEYGNEEKRPKTLTKTRSIDGVLYVAGRAPVADKENYDVMFVATSVEEEEATKGVVSSYGFMINQPPEYLKGSGGILKDLALQEGLDFEKDCYYTALCKWLLPRAKRSRPSVTAMKWGMPILEDEIRRVKPKIIVCLGKPAFDMLCDSKISFKDAHGGWFWSAKYEAHLYVMHATYSLVTKPELYEGFRIDFAEIKRKLDITSGIPIKDDPINYTVLDSIDKVRAWVQQMKAFDFSSVFPEERKALGAPNGRLFCTDCEWHGRTYYDMDLRTAQFAWSKTDAVVIEFRDENNEWSFDLGPEFQGGLQPDKNDRESRLKLYRAVGAELDELMNHKDTVFMGHHFSADAPPLNYWLGIETYTKCILDTEFAQQCIDESSELGLERGIAMKYTTLGLYDLELTMWKKSNKALCEDGYGYIPRELLIPYSVKDVIAPMRALPFIVRQLEGQGLMQYYRTIFNPFVTDVFTEFTMCGLPMNVSKMEDMRELFHFAKQKLEVKLNQTIVSRARHQMCIKWMNDADGAPVTILFDAMAKNETGAAMDVIRDLIPLSLAAKWCKYFDHLFHAPDFNIRSGDDMRRWLFEVEELMPIKSTNRKSQGMPSMAWEKVLELPADKQSMFTPAVDKQTIQILAEQLPALQLLLDLNAVGNICKGFLKQPEIYVDDFTGEEVVEEAGLFQWLTSDNRVCGMFSTTETGRPRSWKPNTLNWPSYVQARINRGIALALYEAYQDQTLPESLYKWVAEAMEKNMDLKATVEWITGKIPSVRSFVEAPDGQVLNESDFVSAEMFGLATASGDEDMLRILNEPDPEWAVLKKGNPYGADFVRVKFVSAADSGIPQHMQRDEFVMHVWKNREKVSAVDPEWLLRDDAGNVVHRGYDIHWSIAERIYEKPRELMIEKVERNAGKVICELVTRRRESVIKTPLIAGTSPLVTISSQAA